MKKVFLFIAAIAYSVVSSVNVWGAGNTYYLAMKGSDSNNGVSAPFRTLQRAVTALKDNDTLVIAEGTYVAGSNRITRKNITLRGEGRVVLDGGKSSQIDGLSFYQCQNITIDNIKVTHTKRKGMFIVQSRGVVVRNCEIYNVANDGILTANTSDVNIDNLISHDNGYHGLYLSQSGDNVVISNGQFYRNRCSGIQINAVQTGTVPSDPSRDSLSFNCEVSRNVIWGNGAGGGAGLNFMGLRNSHVHDNLLYKNLAGGVACWNDDAGAKYGCRDNQFDHNTIVFEANTGRYGLQFTSGSTGNYVQNNIICFPKGSAILTTEALRSDYNCFFSPSVANNLSPVNWEKTTGNDLNSMYGDPHLDAYYHLPIGNAMDIGVRFSN